MHKIFSTAYFLLIINLCFSQLDIDKNLNLDNSGQRYLSGQDGVLRMYVNIWGHVPSPGRILVNDGIDMATLLSIIGGPLQGANLKKVRVYHEYPDRDGNYVDVIDLRDFVKSGDRSNFIMIHPNDTFIIEQTIGSYIIEEIGTVNILMNFINLYINLANLIANSGD